MSNEERIRIGLVTPYTGSNLGDAAIQQAVIENLRALLPKAAFCLFTLDPSRTRALHGVPSLPITGLIVSSYSNSLERLPEKGMPLGSTGLNVSDFLTRLKKQPRLQQLLRPSWLFAKALIKGPFSIVRELRHVVDMYTLLRKFRLLIVSGGGQIDDYWGGPMGHPYALLKWALLAKAAKTKFVFLSVGVCSLDSKLSSLFVKRALELADYRSYRDVGSKELLVDMKFTHADEVVPDLAFSYPANSTAAHDVATGRREELRIGISPIAYLQKDHWPRADAAVFGQYTESLALFIGALLGKGHEVVLFATDGSDHEATKLLMSELERRWSHDRRMKLRAAQLDCVSELLMELARLDCVVASRLHGVILSHLCARPVLAISYDRKVKQYMEDMEQSMHCLDIHKVRAEELEKALDQLWVRQDVAKTTLKRKAQVYRQKLAAQYEELARSVQPVVLQPQQPDVIASEGFPQGESKDGTFA